MPKENSQYAADMRRLEKAEDKVFAAADATGKKRARLLNEALEISPDCAMAYFLLAQDAKDPQQEVDLLQLSIAAGERTLGPNWLQEYDGIFWDAIETRPMMRAMARLGRVMHETGDLKTATEIFSDLVSLSSCDNLGARYELAACLLESHLDDELEDLLAAYPDDPTAEFLYAEALLLYRKHGASETADGALKRAFKANPFVPLFLSDVIEMPDEAPSHIGVGDETEAIAYTIDRSFIWYNTAGATKWMATTLKKELNAKFADDKEMVREVIDGLNEVQD